MNTKASSIGTKIWPLLMSLSFIEEKGEIITGVKLLYIFSF
jgi:hypothetical protein